MKCIEVTGRELVVLLMRINGVEKRQEVLWGSTKRKFLELVAFRKKMDR